MNHNALKKYAPQARRDFIQAVTNRASFYGLTASKTEPVSIEGDVAVIMGRAFPKTVADQRKKLEERVASQGFDQVMEAMAYTWFNRLVAIRFMEIHEYLDHGYRVLSHPAGSDTPEILEHADSVELPGLDPQQVIDLKLAGDKDAELYRILLIAQCNALHKAMPFLFETIDDETELLLPDNLLHSDSLIRKVVKELTEEDMQDVESVGWLYQFYIAEKKDDVFAALKKGKKITPENIPAATQLFTPHWIVRYLVENSLGRLWMLNHPESRLIVQMDYYIRPEEPTESSEETDFLRISTPEEIKICDPACGSGHMLTYAFDLLYAIYEEQGYQATDIPRLILTHNLYGIEIDQRAGVLAAFALTMKAREKSRRFLQSGKGVLPNICVLENIQINPEDLSAYMDKVGRDLFSSDLQEVVNQWEEAENFGSLIRPLVTDVSEVLELLRERQMSEDLFLAGVHQKVLQALRQADFLSPRYHVVVANPPYMGSRNMAKELKSFCQNKFPDSKSDLFAVFIERSLELLGHQGFVGMITMQSWMFLSSYEQLRSTILNESTILTMAHLGERGFDSIGGAVVSTTAFVLTNQQYSGYHGEYFRLTDGESEAAKQDSLLTDESIRFRCTVNDLRKINGQPIAYWVSDKVRDVFNRATPLEDIAEIRQGLATCNNDLFLRLWFEVSTQGTKLDAEDREDAFESDAKWFPYTKGGGFRKWFGNNEYLVNWDDNGRAIHEYSDLPMDYKGAPVRAKRFYFQEGITYGLISTTGFTARRVYGGAVFDVGGSMIFPSMEIDRLQGFLCSALGTKFLTIINPTLNYQVGDVGKLPILSDRIAELDFDWQEAIQVFRNDWNASETSWEFEQAALLANQSSDSTLAAACDKLRSQYNATVSTAVRMERENNRAFISAYGLDDEVELEPVLSDVTLDCNPHYRYGSEKSDLELDALLLADTMREFISYAVGCMLGRYSLDKPGLILANQGETVDDFRQQIPEPTFAPDEDNVIPLLDGDWFTDDISNRFKEFLKVTFGTENYEENLTFLENALYPENLTGKKRKTICDYFLKEFYKHHIKFYKKRPIYWLFSSGKQGAFQCLVYLHRYNSQTLARMRAEYVIPLSSRLDARIEQLAGDIAAASSTSHAKQLTTERNTLIKQAEELQKFDEKLKHYADQRIELDLDDGMKVNYGKFGDLLAEVKAITGKKPE